MVSRQIFLGLFLFLSIGLLSGKSSTEIPPSTDQQVPLNGEKLTTDKHESPGSILPDLPSFEDGETRIADTIQTKIKDISYMQYVSGQFEGKEPQEDSYRGNSGYIALNNGLLSLDLPQAAEDNKKEIFRKMHDRTLADERFIKPHSTWRSSIIKNRLINTLKEYIEDQLLLHLEGTRKISYSDITSMDFYLLQTIKSVLVINDDVVKEKRYEIDFLAKLIPGAAARLARTQIEKGRSFTLSLNEIFKALEEESKITKSKNGISFERRLFVTHLSKLPALSCKLTQGVNHNELSVDGAVVHTLSYGPPDIPAIDGSWLTSVELKELADQELISKHSEAHFLHYTDEQTLEERITNSVELSWLRSNLEKKPQQFSALFLINFNQEWCSCVIAKSAHEVSLIVTDPQNKDRQHESGLILLAQTIHEALSQKKTVSSKKDDDRFKGMFDKKEDKESSEEKKPSVNYDPPLAFLRDDEIPTLNDLFGDKIPNPIQLCIKQMKKNISTQSASTKLKNCLLLYGPPGTGKSTIAQVMARAAGRNILYAGGGDFRDAFQGSGKAKLDALFAEAKRRGFCVIIIDEVDGTSSRLQPHGSTQEDNRALKSFITTLDQYRYDPDIFVICTTNYAEEIDPAVTRRCKAIEISLPDFAKRQRIINYYLKRNGIQVSSRMRDAISPDFYQKLLSATEGFSGDDIGEMINSAAYEFAEDLEPESRINLDFRTKGIDFHNKSLVSNLGEISLLPLTPLFMVIGESDLDKHIYSSYMRQVKLREDLKEKERKKDSTDKYAKEALFTRLYKRNLDNAGNAIERGFWDMLVRIGWQKVFSAVGMKL
jgi:hypothetical protein